jgi:tRNA threonylcarbamoyl adenosine modification protein (Sua5/YciO/YrdC/YwlC family)
MIADAELDAALRELRAGRPIVLPTDTVYGIAALPGERGAVDAVFAAKGRPDDKPLPVLGATVRQLESIAWLDASARALARAFWPGPLTLVVPRARGLSWRLGAGAADTVAVRVPRCPIALRVLEQSGPLAVSSANRSGRRPATTAAEARSAFDTAVRVYLDGGRRDGVPSSVVSLIDGPRVLRSGAIAESDVTRALAENA